jgi:hypothetical protein
MGDVVILRLAPRQADAMILAGQTWRAFANGATIVRGIVLAAVGLAASAGAQSIFDNGSAPIIRGNGLAPPAPKPAFGGTSDPMARQHHDINGRACVEIHASSEPEKTNPDIYDHMLLIANACSMPIKLHVCYYQSEHCIDVTARPYARTLETLGIFPHMQDFRWEYTEGFN